MWDFLSDVLEQAGVVAALYALTLLGVAFGIRVLWKAHKEALEKLAKVQKEEAEKRLEARKSQEAERENMREAHIKQLTSLRDEHEKELKEALTAQRDAAVNYAERLDALQERRVTEMRDVTTKVVQHISSIDTTVGKLGTAVDVLVRISDQGKASRYGK